jgi:hypothetical protein
MLIQNTIKGWEFCSSRFDDAGTLDGKMFRLCLCIFFISVK